jgi:hypothetical protein
MLLHFLETSARLAFVGWSIAMVVKVLLALDQADRWRTYLYVEAALFIIGAEAFSVLCRVFGWFPDMELEWILRFSTYNTFSLMLAYFHWPYVLFDEQAFLAGEDANERAMAIAEAAEPEVEAQSSG